MGKFLSEIVNQELKRIINESFTNKQVIEEGVRVYWAYSKKSKYGNVLEGKVYGILTGEHKNGKAKVKLVSYGPNNQPPGHIMSVKIEKLRTSEGKKELITPEEEQIRTAIADRQAEFDRRRYGD